MRYYSEETVKKLLENSVYHTLDECPSVELFRHTKARSVGCLDFGEHTPPKAISAYRKVNGYEVVVAVYERKPDDGKLGTEVKNEDISPIPFFTMGFETMEYWTNFLNILKQTDEKLRENEDGEKVDGKTLGGER